MMMIGSRTQQISPRGKPTQKGWLEKVRSGLSSGLAGP